MKRYINPEIKIVHVNVTTSILVDSWSANGQTGSAELNSTNGTGSAALGRSSFSIWDDDEE